MRIREYHDDDVRDLRRIHLAEEMPYEFPDVGSPLFLVRMVLESEGKLIAAGLLRLTAESYLMLDRSAGRAQQNWRRLWLLHEAMRGEAVRRGLDDAHCWLPPTVAKPFGRRLVQLGWRREAWECYSRSVAEVTPILHKEAQNSESPSA